MLLDGLEVYIAREDGSRFNEHQIETEEGNLPGSSKIDCYLESEQGSTFVIHYGKSLESSKEWSFKFFVDGRTHSRWIVRKTDRMWTLSKLYHREDDKIMEGKLAFSELATTDDEDGVTADRDCIHQIGEIRVEVKRGVVGGVTHRAAPPLMDPTVGIVHERHKKLGGSVGSTISQETADLRTYYDFEFTDKEVYHTFLFKYRPRPVLELMNIVQPPPRVIPASSKKRKAVRETIEIVSSDEEEKESEDTRESKSRLKRRIQFLEEEALKLRRYAKRRKTEEDAERVDLTVDDDDDD